jgi:hypothetical protein
MSPAKPAQAILAPWRRTLTLLLAIVAVTGALADASPAAAALPADVAADIPNFATPVLVRQGDNVRVEFSRPVVAVVGRGYYGSVEVIRRSGDNYAPSVNLGRLRLPGVSTSLTILGDPGAVQTTAGIEVFVRGADNRIYTNTLTPSDQAVGYSLVPGGLLASSDPEVVQVQDEPIGNIRLFVRGADGAVWSNIRRAGSWEGWTSLGGFITSEIGVTIPPGAFLFTGSRGTIQLVARGADKRVYVATIRGQNVTWEPVGGNFRATSNITFPGGDLTRLFARGEDGRAWTLNRGVAGSQWTPIDGLEITRGSDIAAVGGNGVIYVIGEFGRVYTNRTLNPGFFGPWVGYTELRGDAPGGTLAAGGNPVAFTPTSTEASGTSRVPDQTLLLRETDSYLIKFTQARPGLPYSALQVISGSLIDG